MGNIVRTKIVLFLLSLVVPCVGCSSAIFGDGSLYVWNGSEGSVEFLVHGRSTAEVTLEFERGKLLDEVVAGDYTISAIQNGKALQPVAIKIVKERMTVYNFAQSGCFARADVSGMYKRGKERVRVLEVYQGMEVIELQDPIPVKPGERLPSEAPRLSREMVYQRFVVVPCNLIENKDREVKVAEHVRRLR